MELTWKYPLYIIPLTTGYASVVDSQDPGQPVHYLVIFTELEKAEGVMAQWEISGSPRALSNAREFGWLLRSLQAPVSQIALDPEPTDDEVNARWSISVDEMLQQHLVVDYSPWSYPVYVWAQKDGFACIEGVGPDGGQLAALALFASEEKLTQYVDDTQEGGELFELSDLEQTREFLSRLNARVTAVALNPQSVDGKRSAKHCFSLDTLLAKYLVNEAPGS